VEKKKKKKRLRVRCVAGKQGRKEGVSDPAEEESWACYSMIDDMVVF